MKKLLVLSVLVAAGLLLLSAVAGCGSTSTTGSTATTADKTPAGNKVLSLDEMSDIAPGLGDIMPTLSRRNTILYYAVQNGNWDLAAYQIKEMGEGIDVAGTTRPARKDALDNFVKSGLDPLNEVVKAKDMSKFTAAWNAEVTDCNACHVSQGFKYIEWSLPKTMPEDLTLTPVP